MGWKPSYKGKGTAFTPEQRLERIGQSCPRQVGKPRALATQG